LEHALRQSIVKEEKLLIEAGALHEMIQCNGELHRGNAGKLGKLLQKEEAALQEFRASEAMLMGKLKRAKEQIHQLQEQSQASKSDMLRQNAATEELLSSWAKEEVRKGQTAIE
jgi:hypothetical protein